ncbi:MAG TPA: hypothetical protein VE244_09470 [Nitrososphaeraceae archaeon]|nr:hypothetical protein [Nitrososphaeraceae archaeon]
MVNVHLLASLLYGFHWKVIVIIAGILKKGMINRMTMKMSLNVEDAISLLQENRHSNDKALFK